MVVICLDDDVCSLNNDILNLKYFHNVNGRNRWFDKPLQFIFTNNGKVGLNGEHTPSDAWMPVTIIEYIIDKH